MVAYVQQSPHLSNWAGYFYKPPKEASIYIGQIKGRWYETEHVSKLEITETRVAAI